LTTGRRKVSKVSRAKLNFGGHMSICCYNSFCGTPTRNARSWNFPGSEFLIQF